MEGQRIQRPTAPAQRVQATRDGANKRREEEAPEFNLEDGEERRSLPNNERERGDVAPRSDDESGGRLDVIA